ncbi:MAG: hypothetical protein P1P88_20220, partial [Bacteroidales bacterium]|nr:hypothetical protein [Bacteroidales bacterium]
LSKELNVPVVPVAINGAFEALPRGKKIPKIFSRIEVHFLQAVYPEDFTHDSLTDEVFQVINNKVNTLAEV